MSGTPAVGFHGSPLVTAAMSAMEKYTGSVPGCRRAHARGHGFVGHFEATTDVAQLTTAEHLQGERVPVIVRLSNGAGSPSAADLRTPKRGATLGLGIQFALPSGGGATWAAANLKAFPASTPEDFIAVTTAQRRNTHGRPSALRLLGFIVTHLRALPGLRSLLGHPPIGSFAAADFYGLHAYYLVDAEGRRQAFRDHWASTMPDKGVLTPAEAARRPQQFLIDEMRQRVGREPVRWDLIFQLAEHGDPTHDQARAWPESRATLKAGVLTVLAEHEDQNIVEQMVFDPTNVPTGVECSDDPLLAFRSAVYSASYAARTRESLRVAERTR